MKKTQWRALIAAIILLATVAAFVYYFATHETVRNQLSTTSLATVLVLLALHILAIAALSLVIGTTMRLCNVRLSKEESLLVTAYSSVINFFGPLQSGPAFRAIYVKARYGLNLKHYAIATLVYYFFYGSLSSLMLISGLLGWWLLVATAASGCLAYALYRNRRISSRLRELKLRYWYYLAFATLIQVCVITLIYFTELRSMAPDTSFLQAIVYSGAANLALFVSLTPGAIGFRESFLLFSQDLHHIDTATIVSANILDRSIYIILLVLLALFIFGTHANRNLSVKRD